MCRLNYSDMFEMDKSNKHFCLDICMLQTGLHKRSDAVYRHRQLGK